MRLLLGADGEQVLFDLAAPEHTIQSKQPLVDAPINNIVSSWRVRGDWRAASYNLPVFKFMMMMIFYLAVKG